MARNETVSRRFVHDSCIRVTVRDRFWRLTTLTLPCLDVATSGREVGSPAHQQRLRYPSHGITVSPIYRDAPAVARKPVTDRNRSGVWFSEIGNLAGGHASFSL